MSFTIASTLDDALAALAAGARPIAGGSDLVVGARHGKAPLPGQLVAIDRIAELRGVCATDSGVAIGAHVSYPDRVGFGRRDMDIAPADLTADVIYQIGALSGAAAAAGVRVRYVKPHGALYNRIAVDPVQGAAVIAALRAVDPSLVLMGLAGAPILDQARAAGLEVVAEAYADRAYTPAGHLVPRREAGAVLHDPVVIAARMVRLATEGVLAAIDGSLIRIDAQSICVHGDSPGAVAIAREVRSRLEAEGLRVKSFLP